MISHLFSLWLQNPFSPLIFSRCEPAVVQIRHSHFCLCICLFVAILNHFFSVFDTRGKSLGKSVRDFLDFQIFQRFERFFIVLKDFYRFQGILDFKDFLRFWGFFIDFFLLLRFWRISGDFLKFFSHLKYFSNLSNVIFQFDTLRTSPHRNFSEGSLDYYDFGWNELWFKICSKILVLNQRII